MSIEWKLISQIHIKYSHPTLDTSEKHAYKNIK